MHDLTELSVMESLRICRIAPLLTNSAHFPDDTPLAEEFTEKIKTGQEQLCRFGRLNSGGYESAARIVKWT
jgi:hypothetical protein